MELTSVLRYRADLNTPSPQSPPSSLEGRILNILPHNASEELLVQYACHGNGEAFDLLVNRYQQRIFRVVLGILKNPSDAEEAMQDVLVTLYEKLDRFRGESSFSTWVHRIAVNTALMHRRRDRSSFHISLDEVIPALDDESPLADDLAETSTPGGDPVVQRETRHLLQEAIDHLGEKYRPVFTLRYVDGLSTQETARALDLSTAAVKSRLHRARLTLQERLAGHFAEYLS